MVMVRNTVMAKDMDRCMDMDMYTKRKMKKNDTNYRKE